jgi:DNA-binding MarR family transcriptional regulator
VTSSRRDDTSVRAAARSSVRASSARDPKNAFQDLVDLLIASVRSPRQRERVLRAAGVSLSGAGLNGLALVRRQGSITVSDLANRLEIDPSTASRQIQRLERLGLVTRSSDAADGRIARLTTTAKGRKLLDRVREVSLNDFDVVLRSWSETDRTRFAQLLDRFREELLRGSVDERGWSVPAPPAEMPPLPAGSSRARRSARGAQPNR